MAESLKPLELPADFDPEVCLPAKHTENGTFHESRKGAALAARLVASGTAQDLKLAERVPKSNKLVRMEVDLGEATLRQIVAGIGKAYQPEDLVGRQIVVVGNLKAARLMGVESQGMVLAASEDGAPVLLSVDRAVPPGTIVK